MGFWNKEACPKCGKLVGPLQKSTMKLAGKYVCSDCYQQEYAKVHSANTPLETNTMDYRSGQPTAQQPEKTPKKACCPKCHSKDIVPMGHKHKNISLGKAAGGAVLFGGVGLAAGFFGKSDKKVEFYCQNCGNVFKR